jgi:penicillin-binding protein 2
MAAAVANGGTVWRPQVLKQMETLQGEVIAAPVPEKLFESHWPAGQLRAVQRALAAVVNEPGGTAYRSRLPEVPYAGKTGTAQVVGRRGDREADTSRYENRDHALFVAYAPLVAPEIAVAVVVEHGGHGGSAAAPIAKAMFEAYFGIEREPPAVIVAEGAAPAAEPRPGDTSAEPAPTEDEVDRTPMPDDLAIPPTPPATENEAADPAIAPPLRITGE